MQDLLRKLFSQVRVGQTIKYCDSCKTGYFETHYATPIEIFYRVYKLYGLLAAIKELRLAVNLVK